MSELKYQFAKGDYVFAECYNERPWPAKITKVCADRVYRVLFISHKSIAYVQEQFVQPFNEKIVAEHRAKCEDQTDPANRSILKAIEMTKR
jgi:hypothetical protein